MTILSFDKVIDSFVDRKGRVSAKLPVFLDIIGRLTKCYWLLTKKK
jgi:hypothetical protein